MADENTKYGNYAERAFFLLVQFGIVLTLMYTEKASLFAVIAVIIISIIYSGFAYLLKSNKKRVGLGILFFISLTLLSYLFPLRELNMISIFISIDVLLSLFPGKVLMCGEDLWKQSRLMYAVILLTGFGFFFINLFSISYQLLNWFLTQFFGIAGILMAIAIAIIVILGLLGFRFGKG